MSTNETQWMIMLPSGRVIGPYSTSAILKMLQKNILSGEERIRKAKGGEWIAFVEGPEFYEALLETVLSDKKNTTNAIEVVSQETVIQKISKTQPKKDQDEKGEKTIPINSQQLENYDWNKKVNIEIKGEETQPLLLELEKPKQTTENHYKTKRISFYLLSGALVLLLGMFLLDFSGSKKGEGRLVLPQWGPTKSNTDPQTQKKIQMALGYFQQDTYESNLEAQSLLVQVLEEAGNNLQARGLLCLVYRELWPFVTQDSSDLEIFNKVVKTTKNIDPVGESGAYCEISRLLAMGKVNEARGIIDYYLSQSQSVNNSVLIALKAEVLGRTLEYENAILFLDTAQKLWSNWVKLEYLKGHYNLLNGNSEKALQAFDMVISKNPRHKASIIQKGLIEFRYLKSIEKAKETLIYAVKLPGRVLRSIEVKAYFSLAQIFSEKRQNQEAKIYIEKAYQLQPGDSEIKAYYIKLGGDLKKGGDRFRKNSELVYLGDQYFTLGDYLAAQAEYKSAYEVDNQNAMAAMKAARALWLLSQPGDAIDWLRKAIKSDNKLVDAAVLLSDYLSQRYDFHGAQEVLNQSAKYNPNSPEIFKGFGLIEFRRNNLKVALSYLQRSLKLFDNDEEVLLLLAKVLGGLGQYDEAQNYIIRALEIDATNGEAMVVYGKNLAQYKGVNSGISYLNEQIKKFAYTIELRLALADIHFDLERFQDSERLYTQVIEFNPKLKKGWVGLGRSQQALLMFPKAIKSFIEASLLDPSDAEPIFYLGRLHMDMGQPQKALEYFQKAVRINPFYPGLYYQSGRAAIAIKDLNLALEYAKKERQRNPNLADSYLLAAEIYDANFEYQKCASEYQSAIKIRPQGALIYVKMSRCYRLSGSIDIAESMLNVAASIESGLADIYKEQGAIFESRSDTNSAIVAYERYLMLSPNSKDKDVLEKRIMDLKK